MPTEERGSDLLFWSQKHIQENVKGGLVCGLSSCPERSKFLRIANSPESHRDVERDGEQTQTGPKYDEGISSRPDLSMSAHDGHGNTDVLLDGLFLVKSPGMADTYTAFITAAFAGHVDCVRAFVEDVGVDVNFRDLDGTTALTHAAVMGYPEIGKYLLKRGAEITYARDGLDDIQAAIKSGNVELVKVLLGVKQSTAQGYKLRPSDLRLSARSGVLAMVRLVLDHCAFPKMSVSRNDGDSAVGPPVLSDEQREAIVQSLSFATASNVLETVRLLLSYLTSTRPDGHFEYLQLNEALVLDIYKATSDAMEGSKDNPDLFETLWDSVLCPPLEVLEFDHELKATWQERLNQRLMTACMQGCLKITQLLIEKYGANVNYVNDERITTPRTQSPIARRRFSLDRRAMVGSFLEHPNISALIAMDPQKDRPGS